MDTRRFHRARNAPDDMAHLIRELRADIVAIMVKMLCLRVGLNDFEARRKRCKQDELDQVIRAFENETKRAPSLCPGLVFLLFPKVFGPLMCSSFI